jgi:hypothetical protein
MMMFIMMMILSKTKYKRNCKLLESTRRLAVALLLAQSVQAAHQSPFVELTGSVVSSGSQSSTRTNKSAVLEYED